MVEFWTLPVKWVFVAMPLGFLMMLLFYYDHVRESDSTHSTTNRRQNVSSIAAQAKQFPLKKPGGFHWDFFLMGCSCFIAGILDIPLPNGLVPQVSNFKKIKVCADKIDPSRPRCIPTA